MAFRKPLFINGEGYPEEVPTTDSMELGGLTMGGDVDMGGNKVTDLGAGTAAGDAISFNQSGATLSGLALLGVLDMNSNQINELADGVLSTDAVNKGQLDALVQGLDVQPSCRLTTEGEGNLGSYAAGGGSGGTGQLTSMATTIDGVAIAEGDRILVQDQTDAKQNGIYVVTATTSTWDRASDFDENAEVTANAFTFVSEGDAYADTGWTLTTNDPITLNTHELNWAQFSAAGVITAGDGLVQTGNAFDVNPGLGIEINTDRVDVDLSATPGLEFDAASGLQVKDGAGIGVDGTGTYVALNTPSGLTTAGGTLAVNPYNGIDIDSNGVNVDLATDPGLEFSATEIRVKVKTAGGITRDSDGLSVTIDDTPDTLDVTSSGLQVVGLPIAFKIQDVATGGTVTAAALTELTDGSQTTLHSHSGSDEAKRNEHDFDADADCTVGDPVRPTSDDGVTPCDNTLGSSRRFIGIARSTISSGGTVPVVLSGLAEGVLAGAGATFGNIIYMDTPNGLTTTRTSTSGAHVYVMGRAINSLDMVIHPQYLGKNA